MAEPPAGGQPAWSARFAALAQPLLDAIGSPLFVADSGSRFVFVNDAMCRLAGLPRERLLGRAADEVFPPEQAGRFLDRGREVLATGTPDVTHGVLRAADGADRMVVLRASRLLDERGERFVVGIIEDVTELEAARESMRIAALVYAHSAEGIVVADANLRVVSVNAAFETITGFSQREVLGADATTLLDGSQLGDTLGEAVRRGLRESGQWQGEVIGRRHTGELYPAWATVSVVHDECAGARRYIAIFSDVTERKASEERAQWLSQHDMLTAAANRTLLADRMRSALRRARRYGHRAALLVVDLDRFKEVNDRLGHPAGDQVLVDVVQRMRASVRATDTVARIGGDEFAVLLADPKAEADADAVAMKVVGALAEPFTIGGQAVSIGASIGIAVFPEHGEDLASLLAVADRCMYRVKQQGRGGIARHGAPVRRLARAG